jgi:hypothetical protein
MAVRGKEVGILLGCTLPDYGHYLPGRTRVWVRMVVPAQAAPRLGQPEFVRAMRRVKPAFVEGPTLRTFDVVIANPPFSSKN